MCKGRIQTRLQAAMTGVSAVMVLSAGAAACLRRGLFFANESYAFLTIWYVMGAVFLGLWLASASIRGTTGSLLIGKGNKNFSLLPAALMLLCPFAILVLYGIHWLRGPLSAQGTQDELLRWGMNAGFACLSCYCARSRWGARFLAAAWNLLGMVLCLSALLAVCGRLPLPYAIAYSTSPEISATGARLAGILQYPNAFGAVMAVFLLERLFAAGGYIRGGTAAWGEARLVIRLLPLFPYTAALLLSESRGAMLTAACAVAVVLLWKRRLFVPLLVAGAAPVAGAALLYRLLACTGLAVEPLPGLLLLAGCWAGALLAGLWMFRRSSGAAGRACAAMPLLAAAGWTAAVSAVLLQLRGRITGPSPTAAARGLFYRDAWKLAAEAPWLGRGGETWRSSYLAAQSRPYAGSQVHSGYLDFLLNLGIAGLVLLLLLLLAAGWVVAAGSPRLLPSMLVLVLHGAVDFDWSYGLVWLLLFLLPALALAGARQQTGRVSVSRSRPRAAAAPVCIGCVCVLLAVLSFQSMKGRSLYMQAMHSREPAKQLALLRQSLDWNPRDPKAVLSAARLLQDREAIELLRGSMIYAPDNAAFNWELAERFINGDEPGEGLYWIRRSLRLDPFNAPKREKSVRGILEMGRRSVRAGDEAGGAASAAAGLELLRQFRLLAEIDGRKGLQHNDRRFRFTQEAAGLELQLREMGTPSSRTPLERTVPQAAR